MWLQRRRGGGPACRALRLHPYHDQCRVVRLADGVAKGADIAQEAVADLAGGLAVVAEGRRGGGAAEHFAGPVSCLGDAVGEGR